MMNRGTSVILLLTLFNTLTFVQAENFQAPDISLQHIKAAPKKFSAAAEVVIEDVEPFDVDCSSENICLEGQLHNQGSTTAYAVSIVVDIGGSKYGKPRLSIPKKVDNPTMNAGDRQDFILTLNRKMYYKYKDKKKMVEIGKYNYRIVPKWSETPPNVKMKSNRKRKK